MFRRIVTVVQLVALAGAVVFVVMLFAYRPSSAHKPGGSATAGPGAQIFASNCARCHGDGGQGGIGPQLAGQVTGDFPDPNDEAAVVRDGRGGMPSFGDVLSTDEIAHVVEYTRTL